MKETLQSLLSPTPLSPFQGRVAPFMEHCFGSEIAADTVERFHRFVEESLELAQSIGCSAEDAHMLVEYVFSRPVGVPHQEVGGVMVTLAALCLARGLDMHAAGEDELRRVWGMLDAIREKQKKKPRGSPLPQAVPATRRWHVKDGTGEDLLDFWRRLAPHSNEVAAAEIIDQLERELAAASAPREPLSAEAAAACMKFCCGREERKAEEIAKLRNVLQQCFAVPEVKAAWGRVMGEGAVE